MLGIIRVLTHDDAHFVEEHGRLIQQEYGIASISRCIDEQRSGPVRQPTGLNTAGPATGLLCRKAFILCI